MSIEKAREALLRDHYVPDEVERLETLAREVFRSEYQAAADGLNKATDAEIARASAGGGEARGVCSDECMAGIECDNACRKPAQPAPAAEGGETKTKPWIDPAITAAVHRADAAEATLAALRAEVEKAVRALCNSPTMDVAIPLARNILVEAILTASPSPRVDDQGEDTVTESCGCVFCDIGLDPSRRDLAAETKRADNEEARAGSWCEQAHEWERRRNTEHAARLKAEEALKGYDNLSLIIENALRETGSNFHAQAVAVIKEARAALASIREQS